MNYKVGDYYSRTLYAYDEDGNEIDSSSLSGNVIYADEELFVLDSQGSNLETVDSFAICFADCQKYIPKFDYTCSYAGNPHCDYFIPITQETEKRLVYQGVYIPFLIELNERATKFNASINEDGYISYHDFIEYGENDDSFQYSTVEYTEAKKIIFPNDIESITTEMTGFFYEITHIKIINPKIIMELQSFEHCKISVITIADKTVIFTKRFSLKSLIKKANLEMKSIYEVIGL